MGERKEGNKTKHGIWIVSLLFSLLAISAVPMNLFLFSMPEWISIVLAVLIIGGNVWMWVKLSGKYAVKILLSVLGILAVLVSIFGSYSNPYWNSVSFQEGYGFTQPYDTVLTQDQAQKDLDFAYRYLKKLHPALYYSVPQAVEERYEQAAETLQTAPRIDVSLLAGEVEGIFSLLRDAHTDITLNYEEPRYMKYINGHNQAGDSLVAVNGMPLEKMREQFSDKISYETEAWGIQRLSQYISTAEGLEYLGIKVADGVRYTYQTTDGAVTEQTAGPADFLAWEDYIAYNEIEENPEPASFVSYQIDREHSLAILTLTSCINNEEYRNCIRNMFSEVKQQGIQNIAVDLRDNGGGDSSVATEFLQYMPVDSYKEWAWEQRLGWFLMKEEQRILQNEKKEDLLFNGKLYLLTSVSTFSSAMDFAQYVKDNHIGTIIGEASGNAPDGYGDIAVFRLPESGIFMQISTKKWYRIDNIPGLIEPNIPCHRDQVWDELYKECGK